MKKYSLLTVTGIIITVLVLLSLSETMFDNKHQVFMSSNQCCVIIITKIKTDKLYIEYKDNTNGTILDADTIAVNKLEDNLQAYHEHCYKNH